jgi:hypothetical protein
MDFSFDAGTKLRTVSARFDLRRAEEFRKLVGCRFGQLIEM